MQENPCRLRTHSSGIDKCVWPCDHHHHGDGEHSSHSAKAPPCSERVGPSSPAPHFRSPFPGRMGEGPCTVLSLTQRDTLGVHTCQACEWLLLLYAGSEPTGQTAAGCASHRETSERCPFGAVTGRASLTMHVIFCGLVHLFLLGKYRRAESLGFCMVCLTINNQPDCFPVLHSSPAGHRHSTLPSPCTLLASFRRSLFVLLTLGSTKRHLIVVFVCVS